LRWAGQFKKACILLEIVLDKKACRIAGFWL